MWGVRSGMRWGEWYVTVLGMGGRAGSGVGAEADVNSTWVGGSGAGKGIWTVAGSGTGLTGDTGPESIINKIFRNGKYQIIIFLSQ